MFCSLSQDIFLHNDSSVQAAVQLQDTYKIVINCTFLDNLPHFCLVCCLSYSSLSIANISDSAQRTVTVDLYGLMAMDGSALHCNVSTRNTSETNCNYTYLYYEAAGTSSQSQPGMLFALPKLHDQCLFSFRSDAAYHWCIQLFYTAVSPPGVLFMCLEETIREVLKN